MRHLALAGLPLLASLVLLLPTAASAQICACLRCLLGGYEAYWHPTSSMLPTIDAGQCLVARLTDPETFVPEPGDVVVVRLPSDGVEYVKRVAAIGGQRVQMIEGVLHVDGAAATLEPLPEFAIAQEQLGVPCPDASDMEGRCLFTQLRETLANGASYAILDMQTGGFLDTTEVQQVPEGHVFLLGDNRDNSLDSRVARFGTVPLTDVVGVVEEVEP